MYQDYGDPGSNYEEDTARIRVSSFADVTEWTSQREEVQDFEIIVLVGSAAADGREKQKIAHQRMDSVIALLESRTHATLGGIVDNITIDRKSSGLGYYKAGNKGELAAAVSTLRTNRMVPYNG